MRKVPVDIWDGWHVGLCMECRKGAPDVVFRRPNEWRCSACIRAKVVVTKRAKADEARVAEPADLVLNCKDCSDPHPARYYDRKHGAARPSRWTVCRLCIQKRVKRSRMESGYAAWLESRRTGHRERQRRNKPWRVPKFRAAVKARRDANPVKAKALRFVNDLVQRGKIVRPKECQRCHREPDYEPKRLWVRFLRGPQHPLEMEFLCKPCHYEATNGISRRLPWLEEKDRLAEVDRTMVRYRCPGGMREVVDRLVVTHAEWAEISREHENEPVITDPRVNGVPSHMLWDKPSERMMGVLRKAMSGLVDKRRWRKDLAKHFGAFAS